VASLLADIPRHDHAQRLHLEGLDSGEIEELVEIASGEPMNDDNARLAVALFERTEGNPFFANQLLRHLDEMRTELYDDHQGTTTFGNLPAGVRDVVARRLSRLGTTTNEMLAVAAVAGESFSHAVIGRITSVPNVDTAIDQAVAARILVDDGRGGYAFTHNIVRDVLLAEQTATARARTHEKVTKALLTIYGPGKSAPLHDLAHHACGAAILGNTADAARFSLAAAEACVDRADVPGAIRVLQRGWDAIEHTEPLDHVARFDLCNRLAELHYATFDGVVDALEAGAESARALHSAERLVRLAVHAYRWDISADDPFAMQLVDDALAWLGPEPSAMRALALANGAFLANFLSDGNPGPFRDEAIRVLELIDDPDDPNAVLATEHIALSLMGHGGAARALQFAESVRDKLFAESLPRNGPIFLSGEAAFYAGLGDRDGWHSVTVALDEYVRRTGDPMAMFYGRGRMVTEALFEGRFDEVPDLMATAFEGIGVSVANIPNVMAVWTMWLAFEEGRSADIIDGLKMVVDMYPGTPGIAAAYAVHLTECGRIEEAAEIVLRLVSELPTAGRNATFGSMIGLLAMANAVIGDASVAQALLDELEPWRNEIIIVPSVVAVGAGDRFRGCMLSLLGRHDEAVEALEAAIVVEEKLGAKPFVARSRYWLAKALEQRGG
jgi:tetratricopeptide (TPR) repeat protein